MTIRPAIAEDREWLTEAYLQTLLWLDSQDYIILPNRANAEWIVENLFVPAIRDRRSGIFIVELEAEPVAALFWIVEWTPVATRFKTATSYGQWVAPDHRGEDLVPRMVYHAADHFRAAGVAQVLDMAHIPEAFEAAEKVGFVADQKILTLNLNT